MQAYAFRRKQDALGGAFVMVGEDIREAILELENRSGFRAIMGGPVKPDEIENCDTRWLTAQEPSDLKQTS